VKEPFHRDVKLRVHRQILDCERRERKRDQGQPTVTMMIVTLLNGPSPRPSRRRFGPD
jgi:hypothetical protein